jgi:hypothetical protein
MRFEQSKIDDVNLAQMTPDDLVGSAALLSTFTSLPLFPSEELRGERERRPFRTAIPHRCTSGSLATLPGLAFLFALTKARSSKK